MKNLNETQKLLLTLELALKIDVLTDDKLRAAKRLMNAAKASVKNWNDKDKKLYRTLQGLIKDECKSRKIKE